MKPLTKRQRTILFFSLVALFLVMAPAIVFYSQGYRLDFARKKITQTGGIFVKADPKSAQVYINGKLTEKTDPFFGSVLIKNLLPGDYEVEIKKEGYFDWQKTLEVREKEVTEAKLIFLAPETFTFDKLTSALKDFWVSPDGKKIIIFDEGSLISPGWSLALFDSAKDLRSSLLNESQISAKGAGFFGLEWSPDSRSISLNVAVKEQEKIFNLDLTKAPPSLKETTSTQNDNGWRVDESGFVYKSQTKINQIAFPIKPETNYKIKSFGSFVFLQENENLFIFSPDSSAFENLLDGLKDLKLSPDNKKLALYSASEIWLFFLRDIQSQPIKKAGEMQLIARISEKIGDVFWLNDDYLVFSAADKIKIAETDGRDKIQIWQIKEFSGLNKLMYSSSDRKIYILENGVLSVSKELNP